MSTQQTKDHYPSEKFSDAVRTLAVSPKSLQERIADAFTYSLDLLLFHRALPEDVARKLKAYQAASGAVIDPSGQGTINVWASRLSDDEAMEIARWILETAWELDREFWSGD